MAGGSGTRFWPLSRGHRPKQFLAIGTESPLLVETVKRLSPLISLERVLIAAGERHCPAIEEALPDLPADNLIVEPLARNTAPCIGLAAIHARARDPEAILAVLPADHHIEDQQTFLRILTAAHQRAAQGEIVTLGIQPTRPETGYGYIETRPGAAKGFEDTPIFSVNRFVEKPDAITAQAYMDSGQFLWNSGMFFFSAEKILAEIQQHLPDLAHSLERIEATIGDPQYDEILKTEFEALKGVSIDYGIMEPVSAQHEGRPIRVIPADMGWNDVGHWAALPDFVPADTDGNVISGDGLVLDGQRNIVHAGAKTVTILGVDDLVVVSTNDALLICPRDKAQDVKKIVEHLRATGREELL